jgi:hypothetical protein
MKPVEDCREVVASQFLGGQAPTTDVGDWILSQRPNLLLRGAQYNYRILLQTRTIDL